MLYVCGREPANEKNYTSAKLHIYENPIVEIYIFELKENKTKKHFVMEREKSALARGVVYTVQL